ncbi:MAG: LA2681 family HEPN domain-containing protein [Candidatus Acidiferrales bacterium]
MTNDQICDQLIKDGIDGQQNEEAFARTCLLTQLAVELGRKDAIACARVWHEELAKRQLPGKLAIELDYSRANAIAGDRYGTEWQWEQATLAREIFHLRRAVSHQEFANVNDTVKCLCLNNLGSRLRVAGRLIEALDCWRRALEVQPNFGMSLCNRAIGFAAYAEALEDPNVQALFLFVAHQEATAALSSTAAYTSSHDALTTKKVRSLKQWIESRIDVKGISTHDPNPLSQENDSSQTNEEQAYRRWCLTNCLYLTELNDLGPYAIAAIDSIQMPTHIVRTDSPHTFESFFDQIKQEYVSARWLLYEGLTAKTPHLSDKDVFLSATEPRPALCLAVEKVKSAYRSAYSIFDKIGFFLDAYMDLKIPEKSVSFRTLWRVGEKHPIREEFDTKGNWGFCALYWLAKDFFEKETDEVAEPQARYLSQIRNHVEHKYLRITQAEPPASPPNDLAFMVSRKQFESKTVHLLKLARSALIYLSIGIGAEERRREPGRVGIPVEQLPEASYLPDAEKI